MPYWQAAAAVIGAWMANEEQGRTTDKLGNAQRSNPAELSGPFGTVDWTRYGGGVQGQVNEDPLSSMFRAMNAGGGLGLLGGGMANNPDLMRALTDNNMQGAMQNAQGQLGQQAGSSAFGGLGGLFNTGSAVNSGFANQLGSLAQNGPQDFSGGIMGGLQGGGLMNMFNASNLNGSSGLVQQQLDAQRNLAAPWEENQRNMFANNEFLKTAGATSGAGNRTNQFFDNVLRNDSSRVLGAQQLGLQAQNQLGQLGMGMMGQGNDLFMGQYGQQSSNALQGFGMSGQQAMGAEGQQFQQLMQALQQNQSAGQQRLGNAMGMFGLGKDTFESQFGLGLQSQQANLNQNQYLSQLMLGLLNADANRIGGAGQFANAQQQGGSGLGIGSLFSSIGGMFDV